MGEPTDGKYIDVWAESRDVPGEVCSDARLHWHEGPVEAIDTSHPGMPFVNLNNTWGQAGWQKGVKFRNASDLINKLKTLKAQGKIKGVMRLAIHAHGLPGKVYINGKDSDPLTGRGLQYKLFLKDLRQLFPAQGGELQFVGCLAAHGSPTFLENVSRDLPNVDVVAYEKVGYTSGASRRPGEKCTEPGMRVTPFENEGAYGGDRNQFYDRNWGNLAVLPWATRYSPHAAVAHNGRVIKHGRTTNIPFEQRIRLNQDFPLHVSPPQARRQAEATGIGVELTDDEALVFSALPGWKEVKLGNKPPVPTNQISVVSGLPQHKAQQAVRRLVTKLLAMSTTKNEVSGYVRMR